MRSILIFLLLSVNVSGFGQLASNMYGDSTNAPFYHGVCSGDPLHDQVIIWTKITSSGTSENVDWEVSVYPDFSYVNASGTAATDASKDFTVKVDVSGLSPSTMYYYRFRDAAGNLSVVGRTRTSPLSTDVVSHMRFAVTSCSSIYSGFFNGYKRISERNDIDFIMHLGDYIYDFVDADEEVRVPTPYPTEPSNLQEWRDRHSYYLMDPDLREARRMHPWIVVWDNHDIASTSSPDFIESQQAFYEYLPIRVPDLTDSTKIWRKFSYGALLEVYMIDMLTKRDIDLLTPTDYHILGQEQDFWLRNALTATTARWKVVGSQKMVADWSFTGLPAWFPGSGGGAITEKAWDGHDVARDHLLNHIQANGINNVIFMSGDSHLTMVADVTTDPFDLGIYDGGTGSGSIACDFMPTSISRGNFDEMGISSSLLPLAEGLSQGVNPHHVHSEFVSHGYGIVDVTPDTLIAELWYSDILNQTSSESFSDGYYVLHGRNHWERGTLNSPTSAKDTTYLLSIEETEDDDLWLYPVPTKGMIYVAGKNTAEFCPEQIKIYAAASGKLVREINNAATHCTLAIDVTDLPSGNYILQAVERSGSTSRSFKFIKLID